MGGIRAVALGVMMVTMGFAGVSAQAQTCVEPGPTQLCVQDPLTHDAGEASVVGDDVSAEANGGIVSGTGEATFVLDYVVDPLDLEPGEEVRVSASLQVRDSDGNLLIHENVVETHTGGEPIEDQLEGSIETLTPLADGGTVTVDVRATLYDGLDHERLGHARSVAPITFAVAPPADVAERTQSTQTVEAGTFEAGPVDASASAIDGQLIVAQDTSVRFEAQGTLTSQGFDSEEGRENAHASLRVQTNEAFYTSTVNPIDVRCTDPCDVSAQSVDVELSVVVPGELTEPNKDVGVRVDAGWSFFQGFTFEGNGEADDGFNEIVAVGP